MAVKGKGIAGKDSSGKRKRDDSDKSGGRKRKNPGVLQFFDIAADVDKEEDEDDLSDDFGFDDDDFADEFDADLKDNNETGKAQHLPCFPKVEDLSEEEDLEGFVEERYRPGSRYVVYAEDEYEIKKSVDRNGLVPSDKDPTIWRVKCMVGRERHSAFCLMQKYVDLQSLGTKLQIITAFALEHMKGYIYVEADREFDVIEACKGLCSVYSNRMAPVPKNEVSHLLSIRSKLSEVSEGTWARMKYGKYKGDLAQVVAVNDARKRATVKIIPRIDLQAMARKLIGGETVKQTAVPAPRLINSSELEDFRLHIQYRRDRDTKMHFEIIDGLMLKDGYLYKRVSIESLSCWGVVPSADELQRFNTSKEDTSDDLEWLSRLYGEGRKKPSMESGKGKSKASEGTSGTQQGSGFELHNLVFFGRNDFGVIIGIEDSDSFQILKDGTGGAEIVTVELHELKNGSCDKTFTGLDKHMKTISINDNVRVLEGPLKGRQGIVRQIYRGTIFIYDGNQLENSGYFCARAQLCENIKQSTDTWQEKDDGSGPPGFEDSMASPKSPFSSPKSPPQSSPRKPLVARDNLREFNSHRRGDRDGMFSIGQTLRIRVGPLKGYLCRVIAVYRSDVTVKLDSQLKVITVKCEHLSEVRVKSFGESFRDPECNSTKPFDGFESQGWSKDSIDGTGAPVESNGWNSGLLSTGRNSWPDFSASGFSMESTFANPFGPTVTGSKKDEGDGAWGSKAFSASGTQADSFNTTTDSWGKAFGSGGDQKSPWDKVIDSKSDQVSNFGKSAECWDKSTAAHGFGSSKTDSWEKAKFPSGGQPGCSRDAGDGWDTEKTVSGSQADRMVDAKDSWNKTETVTKGEDLRKTSEELGGKGVDGSASQIDAWNTESARKIQPNSWDKGKGIVGNEASAWGTAVESQSKVDTSKANQEDSWGKAADTWKAKDGTSGGKTDCWNSAKATGGNPSGGWGNAAGSGAQPEAESRDHGSSWGKSKGGSGSWSGNWGSTKDTHESGTTGWKKPGFGDQGQRDSCNKPRAFGADGTSAWNKGTAVNTEDEAGGTKDQNGSWSRPKGFDGDRGFGWNKGRMGNKEALGNREQEDGWDKPKTFEGGRGSGGRRGGRGGRRGGRSSGCNNEDQGGRWTGDGGSSGNTSGWTNDRAGSLNKGKSFGRDQQWGNSTPDAGGNSSNHGDGWNKSNAFGEDRGSSWNRGRVGGKDIGGSEDNWNSARTFGGDQSSGWNRSQTERQDSDKGFAGNQSSGWTNEGSKWNTPKPVGGNQISGCNEGTIANEGGRRSYQGDGWNTNKVSLENQGSGWKSGTTDAVGNQSSGWGKARNWNAPKASTANTSSSLNPGFSVDEEAGGKKDGDDGWNKRKISNEDQSSGWKRGTSDAGGNQSSGWDNKSNWNTPKVSGGEQSSSWSQGLAGNEAKDQGDRWNKGKTSDGGSTTGWNKGTNMTGGNEDRSDNGRRNMFGNKEKGGNWGGGKSLGGDWSSGWSRGPPSDNGVGDPADPSSRQRGFGRGGRGPASGSDRGGFGNRGRGRRGQFSGRGRGRAAEDGSFGWNKNTNDSGGWGSSDRVDSWNQGGGVDRGQRQNWSKGISSTKETGGASNQAGGWASQGSGWNPSKNSKDADGTGGQAGGWNQGGGSTQYQKAGGTSWGSGWNKGATQEAGETASNQAGGWASQGSGWNPSTNSKDADGTSGKAGGWNKGSVSTQSEKAGGTGWGSGSNRGTTQEAGEAANKTSGWNTSGSGTKGTGSAQEAGGTIGSSGWSKGTGSTKEAGGTIGQGSGWNRGGSGGNKGTNSTNEGGRTGYQGDKWNLLHGSDGGQGSGWNQSMGAKKAGGPSDHVSGWSKTAVSSEEAGGWTKGASSDKEVGGSSDQPGGWNSKGSSDWNGGKDSTKGDGSRNQSTNLNRSNNADWGQPSGWNQTTGVNKETGESGDSAAGAWGKTAGSWGKGKDGSDQKGGGW